MKGSNILAFLMPLANKVIKAFASQFPQKQLKDNFGFWRGCTHPRVNATETDFFTYNRCYIILGIFDILPNSLFATS